VKTGRMRKDWEPWLSSMPPEGPSIRGDEYLDSGIEDWLKIRPYLKLPPNGLVVDVGCGHGRMAVPLAGTPVRYVGLDIIPTMLGWDRAAFAEWENIRFEPLWVRNGSYMPGATIPSTDAVFPVMADTADVVLAISLFTHLETEDAAKHYLGECTRVMKPSTGILVSTWFVNPPNELCEDAERTVYNGERVTAWLYDLGLDAVYWSGGTTTEHGDQRLVILRRTR